MRIITMFIDPDQSLVYIQYERKRKFYQMKMGVKEYDVYNQPSEFNDPLRAHKAD